MDTEYPAHPQKLQDHFEMASVRISDGANETMTAKWTEPTTLGYEGLEAILPYDGIRGTVHRSSYAKTGMLVGRTEQDGQSCCPDRSSLHRVIRSKTVTASSGVSPAR